jgi:hypothetical protein
MIQVFLNGVVIAQYDESLYYADPSGGRLNIRAYAGDAIVERFEDGEWDDVSW